MTGDVGINVLQRKTVRTSGARQSLFSLLVISWFLTTISVCGGSLSLFSVDGGPLTDNVVLSSVQRVLVLKRTAELLVYSGSSRTSHLRWPVYALQRPVSLSARPVPTSSGKRTAVRFLRDEERRKSRISWPLEVRRSPREYTSVAGYKNKS